MKFERKAKEMRWRRYDFLKKERFFKQYSTGCSAKVLLGANDNKDMGNMYNSGMDGTTV